MSLKSPNSLDHDLYSVQHSASFGTGSTASAGGPLVYNAKSSPPLATSTVKKPFNPQAARAERYELQAHARELLTWKGKQENLNYASNYHKTAKCMHTRVAPEVGVYKSKKHGKAFYGGLVICGNSWTCPVCASKIQEKRRIEIAQAFDHAYATGRKVVMVTFTIPHYENDRLKDLLNKLAEAFKMLRKGKSWDKIKADIGYGGLIRSLEVTLGDSGWHPHTHEAWIVSKHCNAYRLRNEVARRWVHVCTKAGIAPNTARKMSAFLRRSVKVSDNCRASDYFCKQDDSRNMKKGWGADRELAKSNSKTSRSAKGFHPFALLREHADGGEFRKDAGSKYLEYVAAMRGKAQIFWSRGLKAEVGIAEKTDEQLATEQEDKADLLSNLTSHHWKIVIRNRAHSKILDLAENEGLEGMMRWLAEHEESTEGDYSDVAPMSDQRAEFKKAKAISAKNAKRKQDILLNEKLDAILTQAKVEMSPASAFPSVS